MVPRAALVAILAVVFVLAVPMSLSSQEAGDTSGAFWSIDHVGCLTIGPQFEVGGWFAENHQVSAKLRLTAVGLLPQLFAKDNSYHPYDIWMMPWSFGIDVAYTGRTMFSDTMGIYYGGSMGIDRAEVRDYWYDDVPDEPDYRYTISWHIPVMAMAGLEMNPPKKPKKYYRVGLALGVAIDAGEETYRPDAGGDYYLIDDVGTTYFYGAIQFQIGWRF